jgi:hypothetical protein
MNTKFSKECDKFLRELYKRHNAKTVAEKVCAIESEMELEHGKNYVSHFKYNSKEYLRVIEYSFLIETRMIDVTYC